MLNSEIGQIDELDELDEQQSELVRMRVIKALPEIEKRWLNKSCRMAQMLRYWSKPDSTMWYPTPALEATFALSHPRLAKSKEYSALFLSSLDEETCAWVKKSLEDGEAVFHHSRLKEPKEEVSYNPIEIAKGLALALDDKLFNEIQPNILVLAEINAYQQARNLWPSAVGNKVQYVLEKRMAKRFSPIKGIANSQDAADYLQDRWLSSVVGHAKYTEADAIQIRTVCGAAYHAGIPLDQGFLWVLEDKANKSHNPQLAQQINEAAKRHKELQCSQKAGFWVSVRRCFGLEREVI